MKIEADTIAAWNKLSHATELACAAEVLAAWGCQQEAHGIEMVRCAGSKTYRSTITSYTGGGIAIVERGVTPAAALIELAKQVRK